MVNDNPVTFLETAHSRTAFDDLAGGFMAGDFVLVPFGTFPEVLAVNGPDVASADRRRLHLNEHFAVPGLRNRYVLEDHGAISRQIRGFH
jgi:hypothetical protein